MENLEREEKLEKNKFEEIIDEISSTDVTVYERLNASNDKEAKEEFLENPDLIHPRNEYGNLKIEEVGQNLEKIEQIREEMKRSWLTDKEERLAEVLIDENQKKNDFLMANYAYNNATTPEERLKAAEWHKEANEALYGKVDEGTFYALLSEKLEKVKADTPEKKMELEALKLEIGPIPENGIERFKPKEETVQRFSEIVNDFFGGFLKHIPEKEELTSEEMVSTINEILTEEIGEDAGYVARVDEKASNASANHEERVIKFPEGKTYPIDKAKALICHELGTHVLRAIPYLENDIEAFSKGLPGNETFDEGVAKCVEQAIKGKYEDSGIDHYINIGLATFKGKNFREIYNIQTSLKSLSGMKNTTTLNAVQRCFRGTGELVNNKDLAYYNGANRVWKYIEENIDNPELMDNLFLSGKANIEDKNQERLVYETKTGGI
ncbi:DUF1704 domain-containing protein [Candidatus Saccharibacteria bacterium]|nr:DUF1704 domain-containing protein [Candidatus Saccharibacteria bacterium]